MSEEERKNKIYKILLHLIRNDMEGNLYIKEKELKKISLTKKEQELLYELIFKNNIIIFLENGKKQSATTLSEETRKRIKELNECENEIRKREIIEELMNLNKILADWFLYNNPLIQNLNFEDWQVEAYKSLYSAILGYSLEKEINFFSYFRIVFKNKLVRELCFYYKFPINEFNEYYKAMRIIELEFERIYVPGDQEMWNEIIKLLKKEGKITPSISDKRIQQQKIYLANIILTPEEDHIIDPEQEYERKELISILDHVLKTRDAEIIKKKFGFIDGKKYTFEEMGREYNVSKNTIINTLRKALYKLIIRKLNDPVNSLKPYFYSDYISEKKEEEQKNSKK